MFCPAGEEFPSSSETINQRWTKQRDSISLKESYKQTNTKLQIVEYKVIKNIEKVSFKHWQGGSLNCRQPSMKQGGVVCPSPSPRRVLFLLQGAETAMIEQT